MGAVTTRATVGGKITATMYNEVAVAAERMGGTFMIPTTATNGSISTVGEVTSSSVAFVRANGVFASSRFRQYRVIFDITCASSTTLNIALASGGTDTVTGYDNQRASSVNATGTEVQSLNTTSITGSSIASTRHVGTIMLWSPNNATETYFAVETVSSPNPMTSAHGMMRGGGLQRAVTAFDGISFTAASGNLTMNSLSVTGVI